MFFIAPLNGGYRHGNRHTGDEQDNRIEGPDKIIEFFAGNMKRHRIVEAINRVNDKHTAKEQDLGKDKQPHPDFGGGVIAVYMGVSAGFVFYRFHMFSLRDLL